MRIIVEKKQEINKDNAKDVYWYDVTFGKMRKFRCHKLDFKYKEIEYIEDKSGGKINLNDAIEQVCDLNNISSSNAENVIRERCDVKQMRSSVAEPITFEEKNKLKSVKKWYDDFILNEDLEDIDFVEEYGRYVIIVNNDLIEDITNSLSQVGFRFQMEDD